MQLRGTDGSSGRRDVSGPEEIRTAEVLLSTYNGERFVGEFVASLARQSCRDFRLLVRDDGSRDGTVAAVRRAADESGLEVRFLPSPEGNCGVVRSFGALLGASRARYVMFADQDDLWHGDKIAEMLKLMRAAEARYGEDTPLLCHSDMRVCDDRGKVVADSFVRRTGLSRRGGTLAETVIQNNVSGCAMMINRALKERVRLPFPEDAICHDWYLALLAAAAGRIVFADRPLVDYRIHGDNVFGAPRYGVRNWARMLCRGRRELKHRLILTQRQAGAFLEQYRDLLGAADRELLGAWAGIGDSGKLGRIAACFKYGFRKNTVPRTVGMLWAI